MVPLSRGRSSDGDAMMLIPPTPLPCCPSAPFYQNTTLQRYRQPRVRQCVTRQQVMEQSHPRCDLFARTFADASASGVAWRIGQMVMLEIVFGEATAAL